MIEIVLTPVQLIVDICAFVFIGIGLYGLISIIRDSNQRTDGSIVLMLFFFGIGITMMILVHGVILIKIVEPPDPLFIPK